MKKILTAALGATLLSAAALPAAAQQEGDMAWGVHAALATDNSNVGLGAKFRYNVTDPIRLEGSFTYFFENDNLSLWDLSADAQWLFPVDEGITLYPLAGLGICNAKLSGLPLSMPIGGVESVSDTDLGLNLGGGADFAVARDTDITAQLKYNTALDQIVFSAGVAFKF